MTFAQRRNHLMMHFSQHIPVVKRHMMVLGKTNIAHWHFMFTVMNWLRVTLVCVCSQETKDTVVPIYTVKAHRWSIDIQQNSSESWHWAAQGGLLQYLTNLPSGMIDHFTIRDDPTVTIGWGGAAGWASTSLDVLGREKSVASAKNQTLYYPTHSAVTVLTGIFV